MNWDWEKLQEKRGRQPGGPSGPNFDDLNRRLSEMRFNRFRGVGKFLPLLLILVWALSGIYIVEPDEVGIVQRFGAYNRTTGPGPHYHMPFPVETVVTPKVTQVQRIEVGFRSTARRNTFKAGQTRSVPDESLMLTGDENIVSAKFIVQYKIKDAVNYLFNVAKQTNTVHNAAEAAMREVIGKNKIDTALTTGKVLIQNDARELMQTMLDKYKAGIQVLALQLQDVQPPEEVIDAFKDVASAREDRNRFINEAETYSNDILPKARGQAATIVNEAKAYKQSAILRAQGDASRFLAVYKEYKKAKDVTRRRLYLETMQEILSNPDVEKIILSDEAGKKIVPYLPLNEIERKREAVTQKK